MPVEPGRDVFAGNQPDEAKSVSSKRVIEPLPKEAVVHTSNISNPAPVVDNEGNPEKVPLPKNEGAESTGKKKLVENVQAKEAEAKQKVPAAVQEKLAEFKENVVEKITDAKEKLKDQAKAQNNEKREQMEQQGNEKREA
jgi:hypothetical protein